MISYVAGDVVVSCSGRIMLITGVVTSMLYTAIDTVSDKATVLNRPMIQHDVAVEKDYAAKIRGAYVEQMLARDCFDADVTVENDDYQPSCVFWNGGYCDCAIPDQSGEWCSEDESIVKEDSALTPQPPLPHGEGEQVLSGNEITEEIPLFEEDGEDV